MNIRNKEVECPKCKGEGILGNLYSQDDREYCKQIKCYKCKGTGKIIEKERTIKL